MRIVTLFFLLVTRVSLAQQKSIFEGSGCVSSNDLRTGNISFDKLPCIIISVANTLLSFVGYISLAVILLGALMYIFGGVNEGAKETGKTAIKMAFFGSLISWGSWLIVNFVLDNI